MPLASHPMNYRRDVTDVPIDTEWLQDVLLELLRIPSPSGRTDVVMQHVGERIEEIGLAFELTRRGAMTARLDGEAGVRTPARAVVVHTDTIGCMVRDLKDDGRLAVVPIGTHSSRFSEGTRVS
ncbi:MAG: osmoprotectant NAGGN system M42 family peptidase, partial [Nitriliruptoraceae bacterium]